jgi:hypothetical protein
MRFAATKPDFTSSLPTAPPICCGAGGQLVEPLSFPIDVQLSFGDP